MIQSLLTCALITLPFFCSGTCLVVVRTNKAIYVGADSRRTVQDLDSTSKVRETRYEDTMCKIRKSGNYYYGLVGFHDFYMIKNAEAACQKANSVSDAARAFAPLMAADFGREVTSQRNNNPANFDALRRASAFASVIFFGMENGEPRLKVINFRIDDPYAERIRIDWRIDTNLPAVVLGFKKDYYNLPPDKAAPFQQLQATDPPQFIQKVIQYEIDMNPRILGGPIDIICITKDEEKWIQRKAGC